MAASKKNVGPVVSKKSLQGAHGGGTSYQQAKLPEGFKFIKPKAGHAQKRNVAVKKGGKSK